MVEDIQVETWQDFDAKAKALVTLGYTEITPSDMPRRLTIGYQFRKPDDYDNAKWIQIRILDLKHTLPESLKNDFSSERGKIEIAKRWGNYAEAPVNPNAVQLSWEETKKILEESNEQG